MHPFLLHHLLRLSAERHPQRTAVIEGERALTYSELDAMSGRVATALAHLGVRCGDRVGLLCPKMLETVAAIFGILKAGAIYVPLDPHAPPQRNARILAGTDAAVLVASGPLARRLLASPDVRSGVHSVLVVGGTAAETLPCRTLEWDAIASLPPAPAVELSDARPAYILHTSGSTGVPKGVVISHLAALTFVHMAGDFFAISAEDRLGAHAPFHFDLSVFDIFVAIRCGAAIVLVPDNLGAFPARLAELIESARITVWNSVASVVALLAERGNLGARDLASLRLVLFSGDVLPLKHLRRARERMPAAVFYNVYGQTEANSSTFYRVGDVPADDRWRLPIGRPFPNFEVFALGERGERVERPGQVGELYVCGTTLALGYWRDPPRTAASFVESPLHPWPARAYRTGDLVTLDANGDLQFLGRRDRQVKSRGHRVQIDEIDVVLNGHPAVREATVVDVPDELLGARLVAFVRRSCDVSTADLLDHCSRALPAYMIPERIHFLEELPRTVTGKIDREALRLLSGGEQPLVRA
jgi:amino acid adenylation domain-containing protein